MAEIQYTTGVYNPNSRLIDQIHDVLDEAQVTLPSDGELPRKPESPIIAGSLQEAARIIIENAK